MLVKCVLVTCVVSYAFGCGSDPPKPNVPPSIKCPSVSSTFIADKGGTTTKVTWGSPTTSDPEDGKPTYKLLTGKASGSLFGRGSHSVSYTTTDSGGLKDFCTFSFVVQVKQCRPVHYLRDGRVDCTGSNYGHECTFICDEGYRLEGANAITCKKDQTWSAENPQCIAKECPILDNPAHGKGFVCTDERRAGSICWLTCDEEKGYAPTRGQWTQCTTKQKWTNLRMTCEDTEPPIINNCPAQTVVQTKEPNSEKTEVNWPAITVTDNSGEKIIPLSRGGLVKPTGGAFLEGTELVAFTATDSAGNKAEACFFIVRIQSVVCDPPKLDDPNLDTPGCVDFQEGRHCQLKCYLALQLEGNKYITCKKEKTGGSKVKGYWDWGQNDSPPAKKPHCLVHSCPDLRAPDNGAMVCDDWTKGTQCQLQCQDGYDIPDSSSFTNLYLCSMTSGRWNNEHVRNCAYREYGEKIQMPQYYYFTGSCFEAKEEIKASFLSVIKENDACPEQEYCTVENVVVRCGDQPSDPWGEGDLDFRRKRAASRRPTRRRPSQYIVFKVTLPATKQTSSIKQTYVTDARRLRTIARNIARTTFKVGQRTIKASRIRVRNPLPVCKPGLKIGFFHKNSCVPCLVGSFHNKTRDECVACPFGQYQPKEGQSKCDLCPPGQTTITIGNIDQTACTEMCKPGHYSKNGVVPCVKCPRGSYQAQQNGTRCESCPVGLTTEDEGATSQAQCIPYDMLMQGPLSVPIEGTTPAQICDFTFAVWVKMAEASNGIKFEVYSPVTGVGLEVGISTAVNVHLNGKHTVTVTNVVAAKWVHIGVVWSAKTLKIFIDGTLVKTQSLPSASNCPAPARSAMRVAIRDHAYLYLRDLNFLTEAKPELMTGFSKTCNSFDSKSLFTLEQMDMLTHSRVNEVIPSTCLRPDICSTRPCGTNICIPRKEGYVCACKGGYSGTKCEIPPDYCKENICKNNAKCVVSGGPSGYKCICPPGFSGMLCGRKIADGGWSSWMDWGDCSTTCGKGVRSRNRFCTNPPPDRGGKDCPKSEGKQTQACNLGDCPECDQSTLIVGKGIIPTCEKTNKDIICSVKCVTGKVFPEQPFKYICTKGFWSPTRQTVSCTDPVSPIVAGINYTVVFDNSLSSQQQVQGRLNLVGNSFSCAKSGGCNLEVGSSVCNENVPVCKRHGGNYFGSLLVKKPVPNGKISINQIQQHESPYLAPLFDTWNVFKHTSDELVTPANRALEMKIDHNKLTVYPHTNPSLAVEVPGQFGNIMKTWKYLDDVNWEVRNNNYTNFDVPLPKRTIEKPRFLSAVQIMTCPPGSVQGGVFCMNCPPGKMYTDGECKWCRHGFFQGDTGKLSCKSCPGFKTTDNIGSPYQTQCKNTDVSELTLLVGLGRPAVGILGLNTMALKTVSLTMTKGNVDYLAFNPRNKFVYFSTQSPAVIGRIGLDGKNEDVLMEFSSGTLITGLDIDVGSELVFYTTHAGVLGAFDPKTSAKYTVINSLSSPRDLILDQKFGAYWVESDKIKYVKYSQTAPTTLVTDRYAIWSPAIDKEEEKLLWQSYKRLRTSKLDGTNPQTLGLGFTSRFGQTPEYYFTIEAGGSLKRMNRDLTATASILDLPSTVGRSKLINTTDEQSVDQPCSPTRSDCDHGCFPLNTTSRLCFCADDSTLQQNMKTCRPDFQALLVSSDPMHWNKPAPADYSVPPSETLRLRVKSCHSARVSLAQTNRLHYIIDLGQPRGSVVEMTIKKVALNAQRTLLARKEANHLDCNNYVSFWITWQKKVLKVGFGETVGQNLLMRAPDARPYTINYVQFGVGVNSTAAWQF